VTLTDVANVANRTPMLLLLLLANRSVLRLDTKHRHCNSCDNFDPFSQVEMTVPTL